MPFHGFGYIRKFMGVLKVKEKVKEKCDSMKVMQRQHFWEEVEYVYHGIAFSTLMCKV